MSSVASIWKGMGTSHIVAKYGIEENWLSLHHTSTYLSFATVRYTAIY